MNLNVLKNNLIMLCKAIKVKNCTCIYAFGKHQQEILFSSSHLYLKTYFVNSVES